MTVSSQVNSVSYLGDGVTTLLPVPYYFLEQDHLTVTRVNLDTTTQTLILGSDYSVAGAGNQAGGSVTMFIAPASGVQIIIDRTVPATQETDYVANDPFPAESHERALDKLTMLVQQNIAGLGRALLRPVGKDYYDAEGRQIKNLADPVDDQDAATKIWTSALVGDLISAISGPINNSSNIFYQYPDSTPHVVQDLSSGTGASGIGYRQRDVFKKLSEIVSPEDFGPTGTVDDTAVFNLFLAALPGKIGILDGSKTYTISAASANFSAISNCVINGNGATIRVKGADLGIRAPSNVVVSDINFVGDGDKRQRIWVSAYNWFAFERCKFREFHYADMQDDTTTLFMYAGIVNNALLAPGDSAHGRIVDCEFFGASKGMFAVRVYTEYQAVNQNASTNTDTWVINSVFNSFMWNAVEIAGPNTLYCGVEGSVANDSGLTPFDFDKGCRFCYGRRLTINGLKGVPGALGANTRAVGVSIQGYSPDNLYSYGNYIDGVVLNLKASDLNAIVANGAAITAIASSKGDVIKNVKCFLDSTPGSVTAGKMGLAMVILSDVGGCTISDIWASHASHGVIEQGVTTAGGSTATNRISRIECDNTTEGEAIGIGMNNSHVRNYLIEDLTWRTTMGKPKFVEAASVNFKATAASSYLDVNRLKLFQSANFVLAALGPRIGIRNSYLRLTTGSHAQFIQATNTLTWLNLCRVRMNNEPLFVDTALGGTTPTTFIVSSQEEAAEFGQFASVKGVELDCDTASPTVPPVANWPVGQVLNRNNYVNTNGSQFIKFGAAWARRGALL